MSLIQYNNSVKTIAVYLHNVSFALTTSFSRKCAQPKEIQNFRSVYKSPQMSLVAVVLKDDGTFIQFPRDQVIDVKPPSM